MFLFLLVIIVWINTRYLARTRGLNSSQTLLATSYSQRGRQMFFLDLPFAPLTLGRTKRCIILTTGRQVESATHSHSCPAHLKVRDPTLVAVAVVEQQVLWAICSVLRCMASTFAAHWLGGSAFLLRTSDWFTRRNLFRKRAHTRTTPFRHEPCIALPSSCVGLA